MRVQLPELLRSVRAEEKKTQQVYDAISQQIQSLLGLLFSWLGCAFLASKGQETVHRCILDLKRGSGKLFK